MGCGVAESGGSDELFEKVKKHFTEKEIADLTLAIATINAWNRLAISSRTVAGTYEVPKARLKKGA
jgi:alkylhydroperoxidase family enzyme